MISQKLPPIIYIDASSLRDSGCILRWYLSVVEGYREPTGNANIIFGVAFHLFRNKFHLLNNDYASALAIAVDYFTRTPKHASKTKQHLCDVDFLKRTCLEYYMKYNESDEYEIVRTTSGKPLTELKFAFPYRVLSNGTNILFAGTIDEIVYNKLAGFYCVKDYKTTSAWDKNEYFEDYRLSTQLMFYVHILKKFARFTDIPNNFIQAFGDNIGCFIDGIFLGAGGKSIDFERSEIFFPDEEKMVEFESLLNEKVNRLVEILETEEDRRKLLKREGMVNGACKGLFGRCKFWGVCCATREDDREMILGGGRFTKSSYNPLKFSGDE